MMSDEIPPKRELPKTMAMDGLSMPAAPSAPGWGPPAPHPSAPGWGPSGPPATSWSGAPSPAPARDIAQAPTMAALPSSPPYTPPPYTPPPYGVPPAAPTFVATPKPSNKTLWVGLLAGAGCLLAIPLGIVVAAAGGALFWTSASEPEAAPVISSTVAPVVAPLPANLPYDPYASQRFHIPVPPGTPIRGSHTALVTIVEFGDFECPFCRRASVTMEQLMAERGGQVRHVWRHNPLAFHSNASSAAQASLEAYAQGGDASFWRMHDIFYDEQVSYGALSDVGIRLAARRVGLDMDRFDIALTSGRHAAAVQRDQDLASQLAVSGTPAFFVNGRELRGAQPIETFRAMVDEEVRHAQALVAAGVPPERVYTTLIANGQRTRAPAPSYYQP